MVIERVPSVEMVRFVNSGTEACLSVVRLMRAFTKREKVRSCVLNMEIENIVSREQLERNPFISRHFCSLLSSLGATMAMLILSWCKLGLGC